MKTILTSEEQKRMNEEANKYVLGEEGNYYTFKNGKLKFSSLIASEEIQKHILFLTLMDTEEILYYNKRKGVYESNGDKKIKQLCKQLMPQSISKHRIREIIMHVKTNTYTSRDELNKHKHLINVENGVFNLPTNELEEFSEEHYSTVSLPVKYDKTAEPVKFLEFVQEVVKPQDIPVIQELFGYCLLRKSLYEKAFMLLGEGSNGKSTLINVLIKFLGKDNVCSVSLQDLNKNRFALSRLNGKLANIYPDLSNQALFETGTFKAVVSGDSLEAEKKFQDSFSFTPFAKQIFSANKLPETRDDTNAFYRRWVMVNFPYTFEGKRKDPKKIQKISTAKELSGIFNWAIEGLKRLNDNSEFSNKETTEEIKQKYIKLSDSLKAFILERIEVNNESFIDKDQFYQHYKMYCDKNNLQLKTKIEVGRKTPEHVKCSSGRKTIGSRQEYVWLGIKFKVLEEESVV